MGYGAVIGIVFALVQRLWFEHGFWGFWSISDFIPILPVGWGIASGLFPWMTISYGLARSPGRSKINRMECVRLSVLVPVSFLFGILTYSLVYFFLLPRYGSLILLVAWWLPLLPLLAAAGGPMFVDPIILQMIPREAGYFCDNDKHPANYECLDCGMKHCNEDEQSTHGYEGNSFLIKAKVTLADKQTYWVFYRTYCPTCDKHICRDCHDRRLENMNYICKKCYNPLYIHCGDISSPALAIVKVPDSPLSQFVRDIAPENDAR